MNSQNYDLTISIVTYKNDKTELMNAVNSVLNSKDVNFKLYIVDNSPTDELKSLFKDSRIEYIFNDANIGFGAGHNIALRRVLDQCKYHLCLNPDIYFDNDVLKRIVEYMDSHKDVGQLLPKILDPKTGKSGNRQRRLLATPTYIFFRKYFPINRQKAQDTYTTRFYSYDKEMSAPFLSGCFIFLRTSVLKEVGLFDERFFMYYEDMDLSRRIYTKFGNMYWPGVSVYHVAHLESHQNWKLTKIHLASAIKYFNKWGWWDKERKRINQEVIQEYTTISN